MASLDPLIEFEATQEVERLRQANLSLPVLPFCVLPSLSTTSD
jgi:hypothetical protein